MLAPINNTTGTISAISGSGMVPFWASSAALGDDPPPTSKGLEDESNGAPSPSAVDSVLESASGAISSIAGGAGSVAFGNFDDLELGAPGSVFSGFVDSSKIVESLTICPIDIDIDMMLSMFDKRLDDFLPPRIIRPIKTCCLPL